MVSLPAGIPHFKARLNIDVWLSHGDQLHRIRNGIPSRAATQWTKIQRRHMNYVSIQRYVIHLNAQRDRPCSAARPDGQL